MASSTDDKKCQLCLSSNVQDRYECNVSPAYQHMLFHKPSRECDEAAANVNITLCEWCRHLRICHLILRCDVEPSYEFLYRGFNLRPHLSQTDKCSFCHFIASCLDTMPTSSSTLLLYFLGPGKCWLIQDGRKVMTLYSEPQVSARIAWPWLREQLESCSKPPKQKIETLLTTQTLRDVLVVGVAQACVVERPLGAKYAALSYVWGPTRVDQVQVSTSSMRLL